MSTLPRDLLSLIALKLDLFSIHEFFLCSRRIYVTVCQNEIFWYNKLMKDYSPTEKVPVKNCQSAYRDITWEVEIFHKVKSHQVLSNIFFTLERFGKYGTNPIEEEMYQAIEEDLFWYREVLQQFFDWCKTHEKNNNTLVLGILLFFGRVIPKIIEHMGSKTEPYILKLFQKNFYNKLEEFRLKYPDDIRVQQAYQRAKKN